MAKRTKQSTNALTKAQKLKIVRTKANVGSQPVGYSANVSLKLQKDGYTVKTIKTHNSATLKMLYGISKFLSGSFDNTDHNKVLESKNYIPEYLAVGYQPSPTATNPVNYRLYDEYKIARFKLKKNNPYPDSTGRRYIVPLTAVITYSAIGSKRITELGLFATETGDTMLARVNIENDSNGQPGIELAVGMNLLVEWNIVIQNT